MEKINVSKTVFGIVVATYETVFTVSFFLAGILYMQKDFIGMTIALLIAWLMYVILCELILKYKIPTILHKVIRI